MVPAPEDLPDDIDALKACVIAYARENELLTEQNRLLTAKLFGRKSERLLAGFAGFGVEQLLLFGFEGDEPPSPAEKADSSDDDGPPTHIGGYQRRRPKREPLPAHLPRVDILHDVPDAAKVCGCGAVKQCIGDERSEQLDIQRPEFRVLRHIRPKYVCQRCQGTHGDGAPLDEVAQTPSEASADSVSNGSAASAPPGPEVGEAIHEFVRAAMPTVVIAPMPPQIIPKSIASPGLLAHVMAAKFGDGLPFYRQEAQFLRMGMRIGRATMSGWAIKIAQACEPLLTLLWEEIRAGPLIQYDESPLQVLDEPGRAATIKSYMWACLGGCPQRRSVVFEYTQTRGSDTPKKRLQGYRGGVQTDDYAGYDFIDRMEGLIHFGCFAHVRRKFTDVLKAAGRKPGDGGKRTLADQALEFILDLYKVEWAAQAAGLTGDDLVALRREKARPVLVALQAWLVELSPKVPPKGLLGKAIAYALGLWPRLERYVDYAFVTLDNNLVENIFRPYVLGRKNWLFAATPAGADATALFYSLVESAKLNGIEPYSYLRALFELLPSAETTDDRRALLPMYIDRQLVKPYIRPPRRATFIERGADVTSSGTAVSGPNATSV